MKKSKAYGQAKSKRIQHPTRFTINASENSPGEKARTRNKTITK